MIDTLDIYRNIAGQSVKITSVANDEAALTSAIMSKNEVTLSLATDFIPDIHEGDYVILEGIKYRLNRDPEFTDESILHSTTYVFEAPEYTLIDKILINKITRSTKVTLLGKLRDWVELIIWNVNKTDDNPLGIDTGWNIGAMPDTECMTLTFDGIDCRALLSELASAYGFEYYINNQTINYVSRIENERELTFTQGCGKGLYEIEQSNIDSGDITTRLYPVGGTENVIPGEGDEEGRLVLPEKYIENFSETSRVVEKKVVFEGIHPTFIGIVENPTGENKREFVCSTIDFNVEELSVGDEARVNFLTGDLMGKSFEFKWNNDEKKVTLLYQEDELASIDPETQTKPTIPSAIKYLRGGEEFNFTGIRLGQSYKDNAITSLRDKATDWLNFHCQKRVKFTLSVDYRYMRGKGELKPGDLITVKIPERSINKLIRITSVEKNLKTGKFTCVVSNYLTEKWEDKIEGQISSMQSTINGGSNVGNVTVLEKYDDRVPSEKNVFSSVRSLFEILKNNEELKKILLSSAVDDEAAGLIKFLQGIISLGDIVAKQGITVGENGHGITVGDSGVVTAILDELKNVSSITSPDFSSGPFGSGYLLKVNPKTGKSYFEVDELYVRLKAYFETLEIKHLSHVGGRIVLSPAGMECIKVEEVAANNELLYDSTGEQLFDSENEELLAPVFDGETAYRCYFKQKDGEREIANEFAVGDLAQCREFNVKPGISIGMGNQYYWRRVINIGSDYIDLSKTVCDTGSMVPLASDTIVTVGNDTDKDRQHVVFLSSYDDDAPCIKLYSGINSFSMKGKEVTVISPNADKNIFTGQMVIKPGSTGFENLADAPDMGAIQEDIKDAQSAASDAKESADNVQSSVTDLNDYIDGAFADGIISESEAKAIEKYINIVNNEKAAAESTYNKLYSNSYLEGSAKVSLLNAKSLFLNAVTALVNSINTAIADGKTTVAEKQDVDSKYEAFTTHCGKFYEAVEAANKSIQDKLKSYSDNAQKAADEAKNDASSAMNSANETGQAVSDLNSYIDGAFADGIISEAEAKAIEKYINTVNATKKEVDATYIALYANEYLEGTAKSGLLDAKNSFMTSVSNLIAAIQAAINDGKTTVAEKNNVDSKYTLFSTAHASMKTAIENANKAIQDNIRKLAANDAVQEAISQIEKVTLGAKDDVAKQMGYTDYAAMQEAARKGKTIISGGEINTTLINADAIITTALIASAIRTNELNVNDKFRVKTSGDVAMQGEFRSKSDESECIINSGFIRLMDGSTEAARLAINQGTPELTIIDGTNLIRQSPWGFVFTMNWTDQLIFDARQLGKGTIKKRSDGTLYITESSVSQVHYFMNTSEGGTTSPAPGRYYVDQGTTMTINALPDEGYEFLRWSDGGTQSHKVIIQTGGQSYTASFSKKQVVNYTVTLNAIPANGGTVSGGGTYGAGTVNTVTAVAASGYRFVEWSDGGYASHKVTWDKNKTLIATFEAYSVTGDEIFLGTNLQADTYVTKYKQGTSGFFSVGVSGGKITMMYVGTNIDWNSNLGWILFNRGYLGSKLLKGHTYRLRFTAHATYTVPALACISGFNTLTGELESEITSGNDLIYGDEITSMEKELILDFTPRRDSTVSDALCMCFIAPSTGCIVYVKNISLKEI